MAAGSANAAPVAVLMDGMAARSLRDPDQRLRPARHVTLEGLGSRDRPPIRCRTPHQGTWPRKCGYCLKALIMTTKALLMAPLPFRAEVLEALRYNLVPLRRAY